MEAALPDVHARLLDAAVTQLVPADPLDWSGLHASLCDLADRLLSEVASGAPEADPAWAYQVIQVQVPAARRMAGLTLDPPLRSELEPGAEYERSIRERYGVPDLDA
jgi:hypothetical protein